jgi:hypothetical protein
MKINPYDAPEVRSGVELVDRGQSVKTSICALAWWVFLLFPGIIATLIKVLAPHIPDAIRLPFPADSGFISRISICFGYPTGGVLLVSAIGCTIAVLASPLRVFWKCAVAIAWLPLILLELVTLLLVFALAGYPPPT